jgi:2-(1,2-epoxy-1,2-dihydrophenyl)acetyl-CoA isomerase
VNRVVPDAELVRETDALAAQLAAGPTAAFGATKRLVADSGDRSFEAQMQLEGRAIADASRSADGEEGIRAFLDKRAPVFRGR